MEKGFELNPYGRCGVNKMTNGKQFNIVCYVDYNILSHMEAKVVEDLINDLKKHFEDLVVNIGNNNSFWGMNINIAKKRGWDRDK